MNYLLYGSQTSPFVRRIRILLEDIPYEFREIEIFQADAKLLQEINPVNQIPVLVDGDQKIWDSRQIFTYLNHIHRFQNMDWEDENRLTAIDGALNSAVSLLLLKRSGFEIQSDKMFFNRQRERIDSVLDYLTPFMKQEALEQWNFHSISLYCFLDWATFREIISLDHRPACLKLLHHYAEKNIVKATQIPRT
jgi:glutathione S-transferase